MAKHLGDLGIAHRFIDAIDGSQIIDADDDINRFHRHHGRSATLGEIGCARSHLAIARMIADGSDPFVCLIEDDISLRSTVIDFLDKEALRALPPFDILRLYSLPWRQKKRAWHHSDIAGHAVVVPIKSSYGTQAQIYSRAGAAKVANLSISAPIDCMLYEEAPAGLRIFEARPSLCAHLDRDFISSIPNVARDPSLHRTWSKIYRPLMPRIHFWRTWGARGIAGLVRSPYIP